MENAYKTSMKVFEQVSIKTNPGLLEQLRQIEPTDIVVVKGTYDHIQKLLDTMQVPYQLISPSDIPSHNGGRVMFANCHTYSGGKIPSAAKEFVDDGGRLVTTDWA